MAGKGFDFELTEENRATSSNTGHSGCKLAQEYSESFNRQSQKFNTWYDVRLNR